MSATELTEGLSGKELYAFQNAEEWRGCIECKESHHFTSFCRKCGACFFNAVSFENTACGDFVTCRCGCVDLWD